MRITANLFFIRLRRKSAKFSEQMRNSALAKLSNSNRLKLITVVHVRIRKGPLSTMAFKRENNTHKILQNGNFNSKPLETTATYSVNIIFVLLDLCLLYFAYLIRAFVYTSSLIDIIIIVSFTRF